MSLPDAGDVHVNALLTNVSIGYQPAGFFATRAFPLAPVDKQTDIYPLYQKSYWARDLGAPGAAPTGSYAMRRAPGTRARTASFGVDLTNTYRCINYALGFEIPDELKGNADPAFNLDRDATLLLDSLLYLRFDREFAADFLVSGVWGTTVTGTTNFTKWNDVTSTPIEDIRTGRRTIRQQTLGMTAGGGTRLVLGALVKDRLLDHPDVVDRIKYTGSSARPAKVNMQVLADLFEVDEVMVAESVYTNSEEGTAEASASYSDVVSDDALLLWTPPAPSRLSPSAGYLFHWRNMGGGLTFVRRGREDREKYDWIEVHGYLDWKATETGAGYFFDDSCD